MEALLHDFTSEQTHLNNSDGTTDFSTIPNALVAYARDTVFSTWQIIEHQLEQVDPVKDSEMYQALDVRAEAIFETWLTFRDVGKEAF